jgi:hypothetical protein
MTGSDNADSRCPDCGVIARQSDHRYIPTERPTGMRPTGWSVIKRCACGHEEKSLMALKQHINEARSAGQSGSVEGESHG